MSDASSSTGECYGSDCECYYCQMGIVRPPHPPSWKVFVGNIPFNANEDQLKAFFSQQCENIKSVKITGNLPHCAIGYVKFTTKESALKAIADYDKKKFMGRKLKVQKHKYEWDSSD